MFVVVECLCLLMSIVCVSGPLHTYDSDPNGQRLSVRRLFILSIYTDVMHNYMRGDI